MAPAPLRYTQRTCETKLAGFMGVATPARRSRGNHLMLKKDYDSLGKTHSRELVERDDKIVAVRAVVEDLERKVGDLEHDLRQSKMKVDELRGEVRKLEGDNRELRSRKHDSPRKKKNATRKRLVSTGEVLVSTAAAGAGGEVERVVYFKVFMYV